MLTHLSARHRQAIGWVALLALAAWLLHPALSPAHVEGFSASIVALATHANGAGFGGYDQLAPANLEFFALSRLGTVLFVSLLSGPLGLSPEWAMRATMWVGLAGLAAASFALVRHWTGCSPLVAAAALLAIPGVTEVAFFYNDNALSAALATGALAIVATTRGRLAPTVLAGLLFGASVVARLDAVLLAPAVVLVGYEQHRIGRAFAVRGLAFAGAALVPIVAVPAAVGATIFDVLRISQYAVSLWARELDVRRHVEEAGIFLGVPAALLAAVGAWRLATRREYLRLLLLAGVPVLFNLVNLGKLWQSRQLLPLAPFVAALVAAGWQALAPRAGQRRPVALARYAVLAVALAVVLRPPPRVHYSDGPRTRYGRLWTPPLWRRWQAATSTNIGDTRRFARTLGEGGPAAVLTESWNADRYLHLALLDAGYRVAPPAAVEPACARVAELFTRGGRRVYHLRLHVPFLAWHTPLTSMRLEQYGAPCLDAARPAATYLLAASSALRPLLGASLRETGWVVAAEADSAAARRVGHDPYVAAPLDPPALAALRGAYAGRAVTYLRDVGAPPGVPRDPGAALAHADRLMAAQVWPPTNPAAVAEPR